MLQDINQLLAHEAAGCAGHAGGEVAERRVINVF
jgi:hypothetical protein